MNKLLKILSLVYQTSFRTVYFNFKYLPFNQAIYLPILISRNLYLNQTKGKIIIESPIRTGLIRIGYRGVGIFDHERSRSIWEVSGTVIFKGKAEIGHGAKISVGQKGRLILGGGFILTAESTIIAINKTVEFGNDCLLAWDILMMDTDFHNIYNEKNEVVNEPDDIKIGNHVWVGCRSVILKGSDIPPNSIVAAGSLVNKRLEGENKLFGGQPAKELRNGVRWEQ